MRSLLIRVFVGTVYLALACCFALAQQATVNRAISLRGDPSTHKKAIGHLQKGDTLTLINANPTAGFYHVKTADGTEGWVGAQYVTVQSNAVSSTGGSAGKTKTTKGSTTGNQGSSTAGTSSGCDASLWNHVYNSSRLAVKNKCITVTGTIVDATAGQKKHWPDGVRHEPDGDTHGWLKVDPQFANLLNQGNMSNEGGNLVFEIVCKFPVSQQDAVSACQGYKTPITIPPVGSHVTIVGSYVQDTNHKQWMEIHPVSSITKQ